MLQSILHHWFAPIAGLLTIAVAIALGRAAQMAKHERQIPAWIAFIETHSWWLLGACGLVSLAVNYVPKPQTANELAEVRAVYKGLFASCSFELPVQYALRRNGADGYNLLLTKAIEQSPMDMWRSTESLPTVTFSESEWTHLLPIFQNDYSLFSDRLRDVLAGHQSALPPEFRLLVERTQQLIERDRQNYYGVLNMSRMRPDSNHNEQFNAVVRTPIETLGSFCQEVQGNLKQLPQ